ncbi:MAG: 30S ribosomal protein S4e [Candidatus Micrarchaeota archaeon]|nr:30S ribosomal protein S4e [Candidatus Micrarchaeota archaeon]
MSGYLKRYMMPAFWPVNRKDKKWVARPRAGPHSIKSSIPLHLIVRDVLKLTLNITETRKIIKAGEVLVDKKKRKDPKYPVGFMDVMEIPSIKKTCRIMLSKKGLELHEIKPEEASKKLCKIRGKKVIKGGKIQLSLHDGRTLIADKKEYNVGDSVLISLPDHKIAKHFKFEKNAKSLIIAGKNRGMAGKIKNIKERKFMLEKSMVDVETKDGDIIVPKEYIMVGEL